jgi:hypothetical protein
MNLYYAAVLALLLCACGGSKTSSKKFSEKKLKGTWVVAYAALSDNKGEELSEDDLADTKNEEESSRQENYELLTVYSFDGEGRFVCDSGGTEVISGAISIQDTLVQLKADGGKQAISPYWSVLKTGEKRITILAEWPGEDRYKVVYDLKRLQEDTGFSIARVSWKKPLTVNASDAELSGRLREQLNYYAGYFKTLHANNISVFAPGKVLLPVRLYSGGLGLKEPDSLSLWVKNMGGVANAARAYQMLRQCFKPGFDFPDRGDNYTLEYAAILEELVKHLPK